jgi:phosphoserine phosphatase RsbU/P
MKNTALNNLNSIFSSAILIVDDNEFNRIFLKKILQARGFTNLQLAESGEEAIEILTKSTPSMVILDIIMPGIDGFECCAWIRKQSQFAELPVLIQTAIVDPTLRVKAFAKGATDLLSKPIFPEELCARVIVHLEKRASLNTLLLYKNRIETELESARQLQFAILPEAEELLDIKRRCHIDIASHFQPSSEIGGDFWGIKNIFPHQTACWLVDFSGHGVAAALNAFRLQAYLKDHTQLSARPGEYLSHLNDKLLGLLLRGQFATMFYGIIDSQTNQLFYACACTPNPIILRKDTRKAEMLDGSGSPLGIGMNLYTTQSTSFSTGDTLLLYSDALTETPNADGKFISEEEIMELMNANFGASAQAMKEMLLDHFAQHSDNNTSDDLTITLFTRSNV